jgi:uncharacterized protein (DUF1499 family)
MLTLLKWLLILLLALLVLAVLAGQFGLLRGSAPKDLGVRDGKLKAPAKTPNSISSQADLWPGHPQQDFARIAPLALNGDGAASLARLKNIVAATPGGQVISAEGDYLYAQFTTPLMKYTDDVEFWFDRANNVVQVRSASRLGQKDFAANRNRIENIRQQLAAP